jgi:hypothetical protein
MYENDVVSPALFFPPCHSENERLRREDEESRGVDESISSFSKREGTSPSLEWMTQDPPTRTSALIILGDQFVLRIADRVPSPFCPKARSACLLRCAQDDRSASNLIHECGISL